MFLSLSRPSEKYYKKESVELFVYLTAGIWRGPRTK